MTLVSAVSNPEATGVIHEDSLRTPHFCPCHVRLNGCKIWLTKNWFGGRTIGEGLMRAITQNAIIAQIKSKSLSGCLIDGNASWEGDSVFSAACRP